MTTVSNSTPEALRSLADFLEKHKELVPYGISGGRFARNVEEFLKWLNAMGEYSKYKSGDAFVAEKHFGKGVSLHVYLEGKDAGTYLVDPALENW